MNNCAAIAAFAILTTVAFARAAPNEGKVIAVYKDWGFFVIDLGSNVGLLASDTVKLRSKSGKVYLGTVTEVRENQATVDFNPGLTPDTQFAIGDPVVERQ